MRTSSLNEQSSDAAVHWLTDYSVQDWQHSCLTSSYSFHSSQELNKKSVLRRTVCIIYKEEQT